jgi:hypothetical protein
MEKYDAQKKYRWEKTDKFELSGEQFASILNTLRYIQGSELVRIIHAVEGASEEIEKIMKLSVESGKIKEIVEEEKNIPKSSDAAKAKMEIIK